MARNWANGLKSARAMRSSKSSRSGEGPVTTRTRAGAPRSSRGSSCWVNRNRPSTPGEPHPDDRRATLVELTDKGRAAHRAVYAAHADRAAALFATLDHDDQQALLGLLRRLLDALAATSTAEGRPLNLDTEAFRSG